ncbi:AMP-binding protein, partial [Erwinia sp.]|uniref:AMP-binding protein n=1 Tax=Erwinia citreus TaxID=558 RepID=UPI0028974E37
MTISYTRWPDDFAARYREKGYWLDLPLTDILTRHADNPATALIEGDREYSYQQLERASTRLAAALQRRGLKGGDTALVQLGNVAEFYITLFALLKIGVAPVNALFSHQRQELDAYVRQIDPVLLIADRQHALFATDDYLRPLRQRCSSLREVVLRNAREDDTSLAALIDEAEGEFVAAPSAADEVAFFQLSGGSTGTPKLIPRTHNDYYYNIRRSA